LRDEPVAFGSTYERELARTHDDWLRWIAPDATFLLFVDDAARGLVAAATDRDDRGVVWLLAMWVHPSARGGGRAGLLIDAVAAWAAESGAREVRLHVVDSNERARMCYTRSGFSPNGHTTLRDRDGAAEIEMTRHVRA